MHAVVLRRTAVVVVAAVLLVVGYAVFQYASLSRGIQKSDVLAGPVATGSSSAAPHRPQPPSVAHADTNILIMGLDSRLDENGKPLPKEMYDALHSGNQSDGGLNANVLMLLHIPGDGSRATEISHRTVGCNEWRGPGKGRTVRERGR
jgi:anionic cell wall polymer biosynthesis LytR-Cps2A-Psr (LCP) family protein